MSTPLIKTGQPSIYYYLIRYTDIFHFTTRKESGVQVGLT